MPFDNLTFLMVEFKYDICYIWRADPDQIVDRSELWLHFGICQTDSGMGRFELIVCVDGPALFQAGCSSVRYERLSLGVFYCVL